MASIYLLGRNRMLNEEGSTELAKSTAKIYSVLIIGVEIAIAAALLYFWRHWPPALPHC